jgi:hypothetical protein
MANLGDKVRDVVSGWEGIASGRYEYLNGCIRWQVDGTDKDGKPDGYVFDDQQIEVVEEAVVPVHPAVRAVVTPPMPAAARTGGPRGNRPVPR